MQIQRMHWIDIAKGICMIAVILGHLGVPQWGFVYAFHLTVFFILSGYTLKREKVTVDWLRGKFQRLMTPYFITCSAVAVTEWINQAVLSQDYTLHSFTRIFFHNILRCFFASGGESNMGSIWMGPRIGAIWFLPALFFALWAVQLLRNRIQSQKLQWAAALGLAALGLASAKLIWLPFSLQSALLAVPFILFGAFIREKGVMERLRWYHTIAFGTVFLGGCYLGYNQIFFVAASMKDAFLSPLFALAGSMLILGISKGLRRFAPLEYIGKHSLIFLCVHLWELNTMHPHFKNLCIGCEIPWNKWSLFIIELIVVSAISSLLILLKRLAKERHPSAPLRAREPGIDLLRAFLILSMILGHVSIHEGFRRVVYSIHMPAFVLISGYFYKSSHSLGAQWKKTVKVLLPYGIFAVAYLLIHRENLIGSLKMLVGGISFSKELFSSFGSVGPVYFILMLFLVRAIYIHLRFPKDWMRDGAVIGLALVGLLLGQKGMWLPWSADCALVCLLFYHLGYYFRKFQVLDHCKKMPYLWFLLACLWALLIHKGGLEIAIRKYGDLGITLLGVASAFIILYLLCDYLTNRLPQKIVSLLGLIGRSTGYILVIHTLFGGKITALLQDSFGLYPENVANLLGAITIQLILGVAVFLLVEQIQKLFKKNTA